MCVLMAMVLMPMALAAALVEVVAVLSQSVQSPTLLRLKLLVVSRCLWQCHVDISYQMIIA